jgi:hypothetical protein
VDYQIAQSTAHTSVPKEVAVVLAVKASLSLLLSCMSLTSATRLAVTIETLLDKILAKCRKVC